MAIYFVQEGDGGAIKIGFTGGDPWARMASLQTGNSKKLAMLAVAPGGQQEERALHQRFADLRLEGEWFAPDQRLIGFIDGVRWAHPQGEDQTGVHESTEIYGMTIEQMEVVAGYIDAQSCMDRCKSAQATDASAKLAHARWDAVDAILTHMGEFHTSRDEGFMAAHSQDDWRETLKYIDQVIQLHRAQACVPPDIQAALDSSEDYLRVAAERLTGRGVN